MAKVVRFGDIGEMIDYLAQKFDAGEIEGILICVKNHDKTFEVAWTETLSYIERLGLLEAAKADCHYKAMCAFCQ
ncbi:hypothetical protein SAMN00808754_1949 [Thermanaeromonas toyohensis ToBE]|uniref:Uncharacterized protein n=1 Tax=Thermanaeromonas toyohensis ToBE TaxID=698762 RepID=A0A1W1VXG5_9FIRM|nr:hypothetical protein [Thermanaeromonas toyohensis]SMB97791.1 hypothetical protein SAMN00808754_1949 [Thermanaeromonas toyohensis ToBE]